MVSIHSVLKPRVPYDNWGGVPISRLLTVGLMPVAYCLNSVLNVKALVGAFNQEKALVYSGLLRDCEIFANLLLAFVWSSSLHTPLSPHPQSTWQHSVAMSGNTGPILCFAASSAKTNPKLGLL